ncbi:hypothetical protein HUE87_10400 [Candidatus Sulfurimonas marisnigri]|uniref:Outer membrane porin, OprD family n=1 Tax=Candidatus Sulfurimonas marisnigri TaxID=2740405 RepID=A0A7S7LZF3_9BACT|nr:hypothetical protein [Candidatus Sulfurimonas marisnigri]QOY54276.1 hypothetical protein HUE87_10400 [Candidatus Sulfurimonas marisnigri]
MRLTKLSLITVVLIGSSAFAIENTKVSGDVKVLYGTMDSDAGTYLGNETSLFDAEGAYGDLAVDLSLTTDLTKGVSAGAKATYVTTLGLEQNLVDNTWSNAHGITSNSGSSFGNPPTSGLQLDDTFFIGELWVAGTAFDTTIKVGRQALDTPLAFTETWGIDANTFEAVVLINQSIPDTTLVATYVGKSNGSADDLATLSLSGSTYVSGSLNNISGAQAGYVSQGGKFNTFGTDGVYVAGVVNNSFKPLTMQAWYYSLQQMATAYWLQADIKCSLVPGLLIGAQFTEIDADKLISGVDKDKAYSVMLGYEAKDVVAVKLAYSSVDDEGTIGVANVSTGNGAAASRNGSGAQTKLYTEMWWTSGSVSQIGADSYSLTAETTLAGIDLFAGYYMADIKVASGSTINANSDKEVTEIALTASKSFGPLDTSLALIFDNVQDNVAVTDTDTTHLQVYLTYNF